MAQSFLASTHLDKLPKLYRYRGGPHTRQYDKVTERYLKTGDLPNWNEMALQRYLRRTGPELGSMDGLVGILKGRHLMTGPRRNRGHNFKKRRRKKRTKR
jgi:hypothetical protein